MIKLYKHIFISFIIFLGISHSGFSQTVDVVRPKGFVNDFANVLSQDSINKITEKIQTVKDKTGSEIAVLIVPSIAPYDEVEYSRKVFDTWKIGEKGKDTGVLVLIAVKERRWRIEPGYGLEGVLPDGLCGELGRTVLVPYLKKNDYSSGVFELVSAIAQKIEAGVIVSDQTKKQSSDEDNPLLPLIFLTGLFFYFLSLILPRYVSIPITFLSAYFLLNNPVLLGIIAVVVNLLVSIFKKRLIKLINESSQTHYSGSNWGGYSQGGSWGGGGFSSGGFGGFGGGRSGGGGSSGGF